jgi:predicted DNA-binding protein
MEGIMRKARFTKPLSVAFSPEAYDRIKAITDGLGISMAQWVRETSRRMLDGEPALADKPTNGEDF